MYPNTYHSMRYYKKCAQTIKQTLLRRSSTARVRKQMRVMFESQKEIRKEPERALTKMPRTFPSTSTKWSTMIKFKLLLLFSSNSQLSFRGRVHTQKSNSKIIFFISISMFLLM